MERVSKAATKSHKERVAEFNNKLEHLSEHHDLPKVGRTLSCDTLTDSSFSALYLGWTRLTGSTARTDFDPPLLVELRPLLVCLHYLFVVNKTWMISMGLFYREVFLII